MTDYHLAQLNIARMKFPLDAPPMADFVARLDEINALADAAPGFVWRLQTGDGDATAIDFFGADMLVNMSVWKSIRELQDFAFRSAHREVFARREAWFEPMQQAWSVLWWLPAGELPSLEDAAARLESLRRDGPTGFAFTFLQRFEPA